MQAKLIMTAVAAVGLAVTTGSFSHPLSATKDTQIQLSKPAVKASKTAATTKDLASVKTLEEKADQEGQQQAAQKAADAKAQADADAQVKATAEANAQQAQQATAVQPTATTYTAPAAASTVSTANTTKASTTKTTSSTSTQSASGDINWLIQRESGGNTNASNGQFYGIGQLSSSAYAKYAGGQDTSDYNVQLSAMQGYIADRYGSVSNAITHFQSNGWY